MSQSTRIETNGVEQIPDHQRSASPLDLFRLIFGGANTFATAVLGSFPVLFGLSFQAGVAAIVLGVLLGSLILAPMGLFGPLNGTNNAVSSGAHFGVHGRIVGSFLSLLTAIAFFSLSVWSSGDALIGGAKRLIGLPETDLTLGLAYGLFAILVLTVCIYGFRFLLWVNKIAVWSASLLFLLGIVIAIAASFLPISILGDLVSLGTAVAFSIVCLSVIFLRIKHPEMERPFKVPLYPLTPILFCLTCGYLTYSSVTYAMSKGAVYISLLVMAVGVVALVITHFFDKRV